MADLSKVYDETEEIEEEIPLDVPLININLPCQWVLYLYDKALFKKIANRPNFQAKPYKELCTINTVNDLVYILQLMEVKIDAKMKIDMMNSDKMNLDANDYIIMRKGIEPIWEDPKNSNGGTFTIKMDHSIGYDVWSTFIMYMLGETLTYEMHNINGITVSYISDAYNFHSASTGGSNSYTYLKIWDAKPDRTRDQFVNILPIDLIDQMRSVSASLMYTPNNKKKHYGQEDIISKLNNNKKNPHNHGRGGFVTQRRRR